MSTPWNPTDVAPVAALELCAQIRLADADGTGLAASLSLTELDISRMECMFWRTYAGQTSQGHAVFARFICLQPILAARRLSDLLEAHRDRTIETACAIASEFPLNMQWGFNRQKLINAIRLTMTELALPHEPLAVAA